MVYPTLEAATPPPLVQFVSASVLKSDRPSPSSAKPLVLAAAGSLVPEQETPSAAEAKAADLGHPLSLPPERFSPPPNFALAPVRFTRPSFATQLALAANPTNRASFTRLPQARRLAQAFEPQSEPQRPALPTASPDLAPETPSAPPSTGSSFAELSADRQEYDTLNQVVTAVGNVLLNYRAAQLKADRVQTNALQKRVIAEGKVTLTQGGQVLQGDRLEYRLDQANGIFFKPRGIINLPAARQDVSRTTTNTNALGRNPLVPVQDAVQSGTQLTPQATGSIQRLRFEADRLEFTAQTWTAVNVRITSDPFSPPELELRADSAQLTRISAQEDVVTLRRPRLVFDQRLAVPIPRSKVVLSRRRSNPFTVEFGYDDRDRGGLFLGRQFTPIASSAFTLSLTPQFFLERAALEKGFDLSNPNLYGLNVALKSEFSPKTTLSGYLSLLSVDFANFSDNVRAGLDLEQQIGPNRLNFQAAYRERILNGSLGEQSIQSRFGAIFSSPTQTIGRTGLKLSYRLGAERITANTDTTGVLQLESLGRFQGSVDLERAFELWKGRTLPPTATQGLKYTPEPSQPHLHLIPGITGVTSFYTNGDSQNSLIGRIRLEGQIGHFSRPYLDYTSFFVGLSQGIQSGQSPFLFDRFVDQTVLSAGFLQQIYGPIRLGVQTSINLESGELFNTDIVLDYSRRTYGLSLHYNPNLQVGALVFRITGFNWVSNQDPMTGPEIGVVEAGVGQTNAPF
ncbi:MAG: DUF3769 domain-containing protein [Thermosynechococcaceae cyanobacterium]